MYLLQGYQQLTMLVHRMYQTEKLDVDELARLKNY